MKYPCSTLLILILMGGIFIVQAPAEVDTLREPWKTLSGPSRVKETTANASTLSKDYSYGILKFYQEVLSVVMISRCPMTPSCSTYSMHAIHKHGATTGIFMTADRLFHEGSIQASAPRVWRNGKLKYFDPVQHNDFWWYHEN